MYQDGLVVCSQ